MPAKPLLAAKIAISNSIGRLRYARFPDVAGFIGRTGRPRIPYTWHKPANAYSWLRACCYGYCLLSLREPIKENRI
jgi:hypothetical protein